MSRGARLTIGYSVLADSVAEMRLGKPRADVHYLLVSQGEPIEPPRADVETICLSSRGVAASRNEVLRRAETPYLMFADDDLELDWAGIDAVLNHLDTTPATDMVLALSTDEYGVPRKTAGDKPERLTRWNSARAATYELVVRPHRFREVGVAFDERFGAGTPTTFLGDEYILLCDALRAGLRGELIPEPIAAHVGVSSGLAKPTHESAQARAAALTRALGQAAPLGRLAYATRRSGHFATTADRIRFVINRWPGDS